METQGEDVRETMRVAYRSGNETRLLRGRGRNSRPPTPLLHLALQRGLPFEQIRLALVDHIWVTVPAFELRARLVREKPERVRLLFGERRRPPPGPRDAAAFEPVGHADYDLPTRRWVHRYR